MDSSLGPWRCSFCGAHAMTGWPNPKLGWHEHIGTFPESKTMLAQPCGTVWPKSKVVLVWAHELKEPSMTLARHGCNVSYLAWPSPLSQTHLPLLAAPHLNWLSCVSYHHLPLNQPYSTSSQPPLPRCCHQHFILLLRTTHPNLPFTSFGHYLLSTIPLPLSS